MMQDPRVCADSTLIENIKAGSHDAFAELVRRHHAKIYAVSLRMLKNREDAEDNVQNVLFKAYHNMNRFEGQSQFSTWLFRIAINEALMKLRRQKNEKQTGRPVRDSLKSRMHGRITKGTICAGNWREKRSRACILR